MVNRCTADVIRKSYTAILIALAIAAGVAAVLVISFTLLFLITIIVPLPLYLSIPFVTLLGFLIAFLAQCDYTYWDDCND